MRVRQMPFMVKPADDDARGDADLLGEFNDGRPRSAVGVLDEDLEGGQRNQFVGGKAICLALELLLVAVAVLDEYRAAVVKE